MPRLSAHRRGYGAAWEKIRADVLKRTPICPCGALATDVDHRIPRARGGTDHPSNLAALCRSCHARKTAATDGGFGNRTHPRPQG
jgi:5-methylcytosine-specific restriction protein A